MLHTSNATAILLCLIVAVSGSATSDEDLPGAVRPEAGAALMASSGTGLKNGMTPAPAAPNETSTEPVPSAADAASAAAPAKAEPSSPAVADTAVEPGKTGTGPKIWIWQGSDDTPVPVKSRQPRRFGFDPLTESGFRLRLNGNAYLGYISETQSTAPAYDSLNSGFTLNASGFLYNPQLFGYQLWTAYDRSNLGFGGRDSTGNGLSYGGSFYLLQATPVPFSISFMRTSNELGGLLTTPLSSNGRSTDISGIVRRLPVRLSYHFGIGSSGTVIADGHDFDNRYRSGDVAIRKEWKGFVIGVTDNYFRSQSRIENQLIGLNDTTQSINNLFLNLDRSFGSRLTVYADGNVSKYVSESHNTHSTDANVISFGAGLHWNATSKLDVSFTTRFSRNSVNILQVLSQVGGVPLPNPLPGVTVLDTSARTFSPAAFYRPSNHWTFGATASYSSSGLPASLTVAVPAGGQQTLTTSTLTGNVSAAYTHRVWKFDYTGSVSGGLQSYSYASGQSGSAKIFSVSNGITGGDESSLRYGVRFTSDRTNNPVFFSLLNTNDRALDIDLARRASFVRLNASVGYSQREILYAGSTQHLNGLNFMVTASLSNLTITASHSTSDTQRRFFDLLSPLGGGIGIIPPSPGLLTPLVLSRNNSNTIVASWRARHNLQIDSRYTRFAFTVTGQNVENQETWFDNSAQYHFGRFDIVGGFIHATGHTGNSDRRINRFYFRIKFPFQLW